MLSKSIRAVKNAKSLETSCNKTYSGAIRIDRRLNSFVNETIVRGESIRYIILSEEEFTRVLDAEKTEEE
ncbi:hypothetical protein NEAUS06_0560 [Nematocida ausubeli]|nr:hypothetical protein NEAUS06_0560 [Nematocida ausubeli]